jgi:hypothetical protein
MVPVAGALGHVSLAVPFRLAALQRLVTEQADRIRATATSAFNNASDIRPQGDRSQAIRSELCAGIGTVLINVAEQRIVARHLHRAELSVEDGNTRARSLYERLGYTAIGVAYERWDEERQDGTIAAREATCVVMRKELS